MKDKQPILTVIVPVYNMANYLGDCLDSILAQEIEHMELIVVDAGSTDNTRDVIQSYAKKYCEINPIYSDKNLWASAARNLAMEQAKGKYLAFCDADDTIPKGAYKELLSIAEKYDSDIVTGNYTHRYLDGIRDPSVYSKKDAFERCLENCNISFCNKMLRREFIEEVRFEEKLRTAEDGLFMLTLYLKEPKVAYTDMVVYVYTLEKHSKEEVCNRNRRNYSFAALNDSIQLLYTVFENKITNYQSAWSKFYVDYLGFIYNGIWRNIVNPDEKEQGYVCIKDAIRKLRMINVKICDFALNEKHDDFAYIFGIQYSDFCALSYENFILLNTIKSRSSTSPIESFIYGCSVGTIGLKSIFRALRGWLKHKLHM